MTSALILWTFLPAFNSSHRRGRTQAYVCDPDEVLGHSQTEELEEALAEIRRRCSHPCGATFTDDENEEEATEKRVVPCIMVIAVTRVIPEGEKIKLVV